MSNQRDVRTVRILEQPKAGCAMTYDLTAAEVSHLLTLLHDSEQRGEYYGHQATYWKTAARVEDKLKRLAEGTAKHGTPTT